MAILIGLQRSFRQLGRIRIGTSVPGANGGKTPRRSNTFILTSKDEAQIRRAAELFGGTVDQWNGEWRVVTAKDEIPVSLAPLPVSQFYEKWDGGKCVTRCDGVTDMKTGRPCHCDHSKRSTAEGRKNLCKLVTRMSVALPGLYDVGVWRVDTHSFYAASELPGTIEVLRGLMATGQFVPAFLAMEIRKSGEKTYPVIAIRIRMTMDEMSAIGRGEKPLPAAAPTLERGAPQLPQFTEED